MEHQHSPMAEFNTRKVPSSLPPMLNRPPMPNRANRRSRASIEDDSLPPLGDLTRATALCGLLAALGAQGLSCAGDFIAAGLLALLLAIHTAKMLKQGALHAPHLDNWRALIAWFGDMFEVLMYGGIYSVLGISFGFAPELLLPAYDAGAGPMRVLVEVSLQLALNMVLVAALRDAVHDIIGTVLPDWGHPGDRTGTANFGGIFLGTAILCRQPVFRDKISLLDRLLRGAGPVLGPEFASMAQAGPARRSWPWRK